MQHAITTLQRPEADTVPRIYLVENDEFYGLEPPVRVAEPHPLTICGQLCKQLDRGGRQCVSLPNRLVDGKFRVFFDAQWVDRNGAFRSVQADPNGVGFETHRDAARALQWRLEDEVELATSSKRSWVSRVLGYLRGGK